MGVTKGVHPHRWCKLAPVAQWTEHQPSKLLVEGSNPPRGAHFSIFLKKKGKVNMRILIVEDDSTMRSLLKTLLEFENFSVDTYEKDKAEEILLKVTSSTPDVVLMDVNLRFANGLDLASKIRAIPSIKQPKIILSSGMDYQKECDKRAVDLFLLKPYMPDDLIKWLHAI